ncbi:hypothetical protein OH76DRAFT_1400532 [Lentinus brumalis]|uniref:Uncharacterized protein n=1 Tax=Lentinus brumalis TaxID=2498619 RepID=A0A371CLA5_9APHY|nr:hypothetical protein OH76DRAFT_1412439 [Polyporus brumalis]RDX46897.1 hypothetical protein OH76DRAFT_1406495 [Polyporus brumalis]RDX52200.1 hypothetical protein OH76DRAFT_1400532 [Polyporus brumalis]
MRVLGLCTVCSHLSCPSLSQKVRLLTRRGLWFIATWYVLLPDGTSLLCDRPIYFLESGYVLLPGSVSRKLHAEVRRHASSPTGDARRFLARSRARAR